MSVRMAIRGIAAAVPKKRQGVDDVAEEHRETAGKIARATGILERRIAPNSVTSADLSLAATERLLETMEWCRESVDGIVFVSQTPDYLMPPTACVLHERLGLSARAQAFDVNLGCSGHPYGLKIVDGMIRSGAGSRWLLLVADTMARVTHPQDQAVAFLFGDAGTATALEATDDRADERVGGFSLGTDGTGWRNLHIAIGGFRNRNREQLLTTDPKALENTPYPEHLRMDGLEIYNFTLQRVPPLVHEVLDLNHWRTEDVDFFVFHQANGIMLQQLLRKLKIHSSKAPQTLGIFGNTSGASVPLTLAWLLPQQPARPLNIVLLGWGVGYSWAGCGARLGAVSCPGVLEI